MPSATPKPSRSRSDKLTAALRAVLGVPHDPRILDEHDHDQARKLLPGWAVEIRDSGCPRLKGWWQCALDRAANHGGRPLLIYRARGHGWRVIMAIHDITPELTTAPPPLSVEMSLLDFAVIVHAQHGHPARPPSIGARPMCAARAVAR